MLDRISPELEQLPNGASLAWIHDPTQESVRVGVLIRAGSFGDPDGQEGRAHFYEHLPFQGTAHYPTADSISIPLEDVGGKSNALTGLQYTLFWVHVPTPLFDLGISVTHDLVFRPNLDEPQIAIERDVIKAEIARSENISPRALQRLLLEHVWGTALAVKSDVLGSPESLDSISRADLETYRRHAYHPGNMVFIASGNCGEHWQQRLREWSCDRSSASKVQSDTKRLEPKIPTTAQEHTFQHPSFNRPKVCAAGPIVGKDFPDGSIKKWMPALMLMASILWNRGRTSLLFRELRSKRGLVYDIKGWMIPTSETFGRWELELDCSTLEDAQEVVEVIQDVLRDPNTWSKDELVRARKNLRGSQSMITPDVEYQFKWMLSGLVSFNSVVSEREWFAMCDSISIETMQRLATKVFDPYRMVVAICHS